MLVFCFIWGFINMGFWFKCWVFEPNSLTIMSLNYFLTMNILHWWWFEGSGVVVNGQRRHKPNLLSICLFKSNFLHATLNFGKLLPLLSTFSNNCSILIPLTWLTKQECVVFQTNCEEHSKICTCTILHRQCSASHQGEKDYGSETICW